MIYCHANGVMASQRVARATYRDLAVRYLTGDTHPDHDTICAFRRENAEAIKQAFLELLHLGRDERQRVPQADAAECDVGGDAAAQDRAVMLA